MPPRLFPGLFTNIFLETDLITTAGLDKSPILEISNLLGTKNDGCPCSHDCCEKPETHAQECLCETNDNCECNYTTECDNCSSSCGCEA